MARRRSLPHHRVTNARTEGTNRLIKQTKTRRLRVQKPRQLPPPSTLHCTRRTRREAARTGQCPLKVEEPVMEIMGWLHAAMARRYQHLTGAIRDDIACRVGGLLWGPG